MGKVKVDARELNLNIKEQVDCLIQKFFDNKMSHQDCRSQIIDILSSHTVFKSEYDKYMEYVDNLLSERQLTLPI